MKSKLLLTTMTAMILVAGCSPGATNNVTANVAANAATPANATAATPANGAAPANSADAAPVSTGPVDQAFLVGRWGMAGDCSQVMEFKADGTATPPEGSTYTISGSTVTVTSPGHARIPRPSPAPATMR